MRQMFSDHPFRQQAWKFILQLCSKTIPFATHLVPDTTNRRAVFNTANTSRLAGTGGVHPGCESFVIPILNEELGWQRRPASGFDDFLRVFKDVFSNLICKLLYPCDIS